MIGTKKSQNPKKILGERVLAVDVDDTLIIWNKSSVVDTPPTLYKSPTGKDVLLHPHGKNLLLVEKFYKLGYTILVWSGSGVDWAECICQQLGIDHMVTNYMTKPGYMLDDQPVKEWSRRLWRDPVTGRNSPQGAVSSFSSEIAKAREDVAIRRFNEHAVLKGLKKYE